MTVDPFYRTMVEEKDLIDEQIVVTHNGNVHIVDVEFLIELIESLAEDEQKLNIKNTFCLIDFKNGNLMNYLEFLAKAYVETNF